VQAWVKGALAAPRTAPGCGAGAGPQPAAVAARSTSRSSVRSSRSRCRSIKKISGANLARNWVMIPHVTQHDEADITELEAFRKKLGDENKELKVSPLVFQIKAGGRRRSGASRNFNASLDASRREPDPEAATSTSASRSDTPDGLVVPVIRDCDKKGLLELAAEMGTISAKAREKKLGPAEMSGGCFSISSLGGIGGTKLHADRERARGGDPRRVQGRDEARVERQRVRAAPDAAALAQLRPTA
jgi:pyruvate dehydrogenase E2 component (dihydrolipoamide acetyltransferase)